MKYTHRKLFCTLFFYVMIIILIICAEQFTQILYPLIHGALSCAIFVGEFFHGRGTYRNRVMRLSIVVLLVLSSCFIFILIGEYQFLISQVTLVGFATIIESRYFNDYFVTVPKNTVGLVIMKSRAVKNRILRSGSYFSVPWEKIRFISQSGSVDANLSIALTLESRISGISHKAQMICIVSLCAKGEYVLDERILSSGATLSTQDYFDYNLNIDLSKRFDEYIKQRSTEAQRFYQESTNVLSQVNDIQLMFDCFEYSGNELQLMFKNHVNMFKRFPELKKELIHEAATHSYQLRGLELILSQVGFIRPHL